jgi:hypothetical protein
VTGSGGPISYFGEAVDICGTTAIVGSKGIGERAVYIFREDQNGVWNQVFNFTFPGSHAEDYDKLVSISGHFAVASARPNGDIYIFHENAQGEWSLFDQLSKNDGGYGFSSAIDGDTVLVAAMWDDEIALVLCHILILG